MSTSSVPPAPAPAPGRAQVVKALLESFGPLLVFFAFEHLWGLVPAIVSGVVLGAALVGRQIHRDRKVSGMTAFMAGSVLVFGGLDLFFQTGFFVKLEPALGNAATGLFMLGLLLSRKPVLADLAEQQRGEPLEPWARRYLSVTMPAVWAAFFFLRSAGFVWMAYHLTVDQEMAVRASLGNALYAVLIAGQFVHMRWLGRRAARAEG